MNWAAVTAAVSCLTLLIVLLGGAHFSGKLVEKVTRNDERIGAVESRVGRHDHHLGKIDVALVELQKYQEGFTAASRIMGNQSTQKDTRNETAI